MAVRCGVSQATFETFHVAYLSYIFFVFQSGPKSPWALLTLSALDWRRIMSSGKLAAVCPRLCRAAAPSVVKTSGTRFVTAAQLPSAKRRANQQQQRWKGTFAPRHGKAIEPATLDKGSLQRQQQQAELNQDATQEPNELGQEGCGTGVAEEERQQQQQEPQRQASEVEEDGVKDKQSASVANVGDERLEQKAAQSASSPVENEPKPSTSTSKEPENTAGGAENIDTNPDPADISSQPTSEPPEVDIPLPDAATPGGPLEAIMHMPPPEDMEKKSSPPTMSPPRYVHHFDSYTLVKQLQEGGYTQNQSIAFMKGIRKLLAEHIDVAQESLVSKSDVENVS